MGMSNKKMIDEMSMAMYWCGAGPSYEKEHLVSPGSAFWVIAKEMIEKKESRNKLVAFEKIKSINVIFRGGFTIVTCSVVSVWGNKITYIGVACKSRKDKDDKVVAFKIALNRALKDCVVVSYEHGRM